MKKLIVVAILAMSISGIAQEKKNHRNVERPELTAEQQNVLQVKKLTLELDLNAKQQKEIAEIVGKQQSKRIALRTEMKTKKAANKKLTPDDKFVLKSQILDEKIALKSEMKKVLSPDQLVKWELMQKNKMKTQHKKMQKRNRDKK